MDKAEKLSIVKRNEIVFGKLSRLKRNMELVIKKSQHMLWVTEKSTLHMS